MYDSPATRQGIFLFSPQISTKKYISIMLCFKLDTTKKGERNMKNIWKKWWFWIIIAIFFVIGKVTDNTDNTEEKAATTDTKQVVAEQEEKKVDNEPKKQNDEKAEEMTKKLKEDIRLDFGDADGEEAVSWYHHFSGFRIDLKNKMVYVESDLSSSDEENALHLANAVLNTMNLKKEKYFDVKKVIVLDKNGKEMFTKENYQ